MAPPMKPSREEMLAVTMNQKLAKQGAKTRKLAESRDVNTLPDPKTYAAVMGLLGERPDEMGFSVAHPKYKEIMDVADPAFALGTAAQVVPLVKPAGQAVRGAAKALAPKAGQMVMDAAQATGMPVYGLGVVESGKSAAKAGAFYSSLDQAAANLPRNKGTGKEFMTELRKQPGVKKAEIDDRKLAEIEAMPKMTKDEFLDALSSKPVPKISEKVLSDENVPEEVQSLAYTMLYDSARNTIKGNYRGYSPEWIEAQAQKLGDKWVKEGTEMPYFLEAAADELGVPLEKTAYKDYATPGGQNYREILLKLPSNRPSIKDMSRAEYNAAVEAADKAGVQNYQSRHWDDPNVLAHIRVSDRIGPNGEKILHVDEIQSDWHQAAREMREDKIKEIMAIKGVDKKTASDMVPADYGYHIVKPITELPSNYVVQESAFSKNPAHKYEVFNKDTGLLYGFSGATPEEAIEKTLASMNSIKSENAAGRVPDAPFKKNWHELAMKKIMDMAAEGGYDKVAITPGAEQANRYKLSNALDEINVTSRTHAGTGEVSKSVALDTKDGRSLRLGVSNDGTIDNVNDAAIANFVGKSLDEVIGKDMAKKIMEGGTQTISGEGLAVGGEGMKGFYDEMLPAYLKKQYGVDVGSTRVQAGTEPMRNAEGDMTWATKPIYMDVHSIDITPEMRESIKSKGQPFYQAIGAGTAGAAASEFPEPEGYKNGGEVKMGVGGLLALGKGAQKAEKGAQVIKASEAFGAHEGLPVYITQSDRTKVGQGFLGGPGFSGLQHTSEPHREARAAWGVKTPGVANTIVGDPAMGKNPLFTTMIGSPTQHQSNQMVFDKMYRQFKNEAKKGNLSDELRFMINDKLAKAVDKDGKNVFPPNVDILSKDFHKMADTFDRRSIAGHLMGGVGIGGKKGQIIDYDKIIKGTTDPGLIDAPSGAIGNRIFTLDKNIINRPDLHPAFPTIMTGEDMNVMYNPVPRELFMQDFINQVRNEKGRNPGYLDYIRGRPPSQFISEDWLTKLQKEGHKKGGLLKVKRKK